MKAKSLQYNVKPTQLHCHGLKISHQGLLRRSTQAGASCSTSPITLTLQNSNGNSDISDAIIALKQVQGVSDVAVIGSSAEVFTSEPIFVRDLIEAVRVANAGIRAVPYQSNTWTWRGHQIHYGVAGPESAPPVVLVHGFGGNANHYRKLIADLMGSYRVYAVDLLGFGQSDKPRAAYCPQLWGDQIGEFVQQVVQSKAFLVGNSIGSQVSLYTAAFYPCDIRGVCCLNISGSMNVKGLYQDSLTLVALTPFFWFVERLLHIRPLAAYLFDNFANPENIRRILAQEVDAPPSVYVNKASVHQELVDILIEPAQDTGAVDVFSRVFTGDPGPRPEALMQSVKCPVGVVWGEMDPWTPVDGAVAEHFKGLAESGDEAQVSFVTVEEVGHCPMDDRPELVSPRVLEWMDSVSE